MINKKFIKVRMSSQCRLYLLMFHDITQQKRIMYQDERNWYFGQNEMFIGSRDELSEDIVWRRSL